MPLVTEVSGPATPPARSRASKILKPRSSLRNLAGQSSTHSLTSNDTTGDHSSSGIGSSRDGAGEGPKTATPERRSSIDTSKIKKLLPGRRKRDKKPSVVQSLESDPLASRTAPSLDSLEHQDASGKSSLLTDDSDTDAYVYTASPSSPSYSSSSPV